jgi:hypothetical protein
MDGKVFRFTLTGAFNMPTGFSGHSNFLITSPISISQALEIIAPFILTRPDNAGSNSEGGLTSRCEACAAKAIAVSKNVSTAYINLLIVSGSDIKKTPAGYRRFQLSRWVYW